MTPSGPSMLALVDDLHGPALWRCLFPLKALEDRGYPCGWAHKDRRSSALLARRCDGLLLARVSWPGWARRMVAAEFDDWRRQGRFVVYDADDDLWRPELIDRLLETGQAGGKSAHELEADRRERLFALGLADGVTVSTEPLAEIARGVTDVPVIVVPNAIDVSWFRAALRRASRRIPPLTIGWAGGARPNADLEAMAVGWARIAARYPDVRFVVQGHVPGAVRWLVPEDRLHVLPWMPLERYPEGLVNVDVACCAVVPSPFNECKSLIKAYEAAVAGAAVVATPTLYGQLVRHGETGLLAETAADWEDALATLLERPSYRSLLAGRLRKHVERRCSLDANLQRWPRAWSEIAEHARARRGLVVA